MSTTSVVAAIKCELKCSLKCLLLESAKQSISVIYVVTRSYREDKEETRGSNVSM